MTMGCNKFRSFSSPPDFPSSCSPFYSATVPVVGWEDEELWSPVSPRVVKDAEIRSKSPSIYSRPFISPTPCPDSGGSSSSSSPFAFSSSAAASTFQKPSNGISTAKAAFHSSPRSYLPSAVCSSASRIVFEEVSAHPVTLTRDGICILPPHRVQPSPARRSLPVYTRGTETSGIRSPHVAEYFSAGEDVDFNTTYQKPLPPRYSFSDCDINTSQLAHPDATDAGSADPEDLTISHSVECTLPDLVAFSTRVAQSSVRPTGISRGTGIALVSRERASRAPTGGGLCMHRAAEQQRQKAGCQHQQHRREEQQHQQREEQYHQQRPRQEEQHQQQLKDEHYQQHLRDEHHQQRQRESGFQQQWRDRFEQLRRLPDGLQQRQQRKDEPQRLQGGRLQQLYHRDTTCGLIRKISARQQHLLTSFPSAKNGQIQLLQERLRKGFSDQATSQKDSSSTLALLRSLSRENKCGNCFFNDKKGTLPRSSRAESSLSAAASRLHAVSRPAYAACMTRVLAQNSHMHHMQKQLRPHDEVRKRTADVKRKEKIPRDRRVVFMFALLLLDVIIIGSTSTQHALNPASLIDKVLLTHVSFSASLCALSAGTPAGIAECLASAAAGNTAAAAASTVAAENTGEWERGLLSREEEQQQVEVPPLQLLRDPYFLPHYDRYLPHSLKRELGLSCVCGWAALVVLGILSLWVALRDRSLAARVFPAITTSRLGRGSVCSVNGKDAGRSLAQDSRSSAGCSRDRDETCITPCRTSWSSSRCSSPTREKGSCASECHRCFEDCCCCSTAYHSSNCRASGVASSRSSRPFNSACVCSSNSSPLSTGMTKRGSRLAEHHACCCSCREPENRELQLGAAAAETAKRASGSGRSRRKGVANACDADVKARLREYEEIVLKEYQARVVTEARARIFCLSLFALLIFFGMNFIVQLNVRCHRTKYQFYTLQSLAAAALHEEAPPAGAGGAGKSSNVQEGGPRRELPTTPNTPLPPLKLLLHAQQPAAASSAYYFGEDDDDIVRQQQAEGEKEEEIAGQQVESRGRQQNKQEPPTSPSYVYYRDYLFWYQLFADFCRDAEMQLSVVWIVLHIAAVVSCRNLMREAEEHIKGVLDTFRRRYRHSSKACRSI